MPIDYQPPSSQEYKHEALFTAITEIPENLVLLSQQVFSDQIKDSPNSGERMSKPSRLNDYGSIASMDLPDGFHQTETGRGFGDNNRSAPKEFRSETETIGAWNNRIPETSKTALEDLLKKTPHSLSDDEYFSISELMAPGPWSGDGRNHELGLRLEEFNGKKALVYDYWKTRDISRDGPLAKPEADDIRGRVVFFPNEKTGRVDVLWMRSQYEDFENASKKFNRTLNSIEWK